MSMQSKDYLQAIEAAGEGNEGDRIKGLNLPGMLERVNRQVRVQHSKQDRQLENLTSLQDLCWPCTHPGARNALSRKKRRVKEDASTALYAPFLTLTAHRERERLASACAHAEQANPVVQPKGLGIQLAQQNGQRLLRLSIGVGMQTDRHGESGQANLPPMPLISASCHQPYSDVASLC